MDNDADNESREKILADVKYVAKRLLERLTDIVDSKASSGKEDKLFGRASLVTALASITELLLRLDEAERQFAGKEPVAMLSPPGSLSEADMVLVEAFLAKVKNGGIL